MYKNVVTPGTSWVVMAGSGPPISQMTPAASVEPNAASTWTALTSGRLSLIRRELPSAAPDATYAHDPIQRSGGAPEDVKTEALPDAAMIHRFGSGPTSTSDVVTRA